MSDSSEPGDLSNKASTPGGPGWRDAKTKGKLNEAPGPSSAAYPIAGEVRGFQSRTESRGPQHPTYIIWTFRLERFDPNGNRLAPVPVEMRSKSFKGFINEGDRVGISARWKEGQIVRIRKLHNLSTGAMVVAGSSFEWTVIVKIILFLAVLLFIGTIAMRLLQKKPTPRPVKIKITLTAPIVEQNLLDSRNFQEA